MAREITVAPPGMTISQGRTFMVIDQRGEINPSGDEDVYAIDTRFIDTYRLFLNCEPWELVNASPSSFYAARFHLTNPRIRAEDGDLDAHALGFTIHRTVGEGIHEDFGLMNYTTRKIRCVLELALHSDFADIFEVKAKSFVQRGRLQTQWDEQQGKLRTTYTSGDFHRAITDQLLNLTAPFGYTNGRLFFEVELEAGQGWHMCGEMLLEHGALRHEKSYPRV